VKADTPMSSGGTVNAIVRTPENIDCPRAARGDRHESTR